VGGYLFHFLMTSKVGLGRQDGKRFSFSSFEEFFFSYTYLFVLNLGGVELAPVGLVTYRTWSV